MHLFIRLHVNLNVVLICLFELDVILWLHEALGVGILLYIFCPYSKSRTCRHGIVLLREIYFRQFSVG
jgi:hypothetical protein